jgi:hypothetical protein
LTAFVVAQGDGTRTISKEIREVAAAAGGVAAPPLSQSGAAPNREPPLRSGWRTFTSQQIVHWYKDNVRASTRSIYLSLTVFVVAQDDGTCTFANELPDDVASVEQTYFKERTQWRLVYWHDRRGYYKAGISSAFKASGPSPVEVAAAAAAAAGGSNVVPSEVDGWRLCCNAHEKPSWTRSAQVRLVFSIHGLKCNAHV